MAAKQLKGAFFEHLVKRVLLRCGFRAVKPDGLFVFSRGRQQFVNGKGAAHDADVLVEPPIQIPFIYPYRIIFECKAYTGKIRLPVVRNIHGLRDDLNEFEIVTKQHLSDRQNNRRSAIAVLNRSRHLYQVGLACISPLTKPALEFAINNKIPVLSFPWLLSSDVFDRLSTFYDRDDDIDVHEGLAESFASGVVQNWEQYDLGEETSTLFRDVCAEVEQHVWVGLIESGDIVFLKMSDGAVTYLNDSRELNHEGKFHYSANNPELWRLTIGPNERVAHFRLPEAVVREWADQDFEHSAAVHMKAGRFSRMLIFTGKPERPVVTVNIDKQWLAEVAAEAEGEDIGEFQ